MKQMQSVYKMWHCILVSNKSHGHDKFSNIRLRCPPTETMAGMCTSGDLTFDGFSGNLSHVGLPTPLVETLQSKSLTLDSTL